MLELQPDSGVIGKQKMQETNYNAAAVLSTPRAFIQALLTDLRILLPISRQLFVRNLRVQVRQSVLGYVWLLIPPLVVGLVWAYLGHARVVTHQATTVPYALFVLAGVFLWQGFADAVQCPLQQLTAVKPTLAKVRVPHEAFIMAGMGVVLFNQTIRLGLLLVMFLFFGVSWSPTLLLLPVGIVALLLVGLSLGWLLAPVGLLYTDMANALPIVLNLWFLITPVVYTPPAALVGWLRFNPVAPLLTTTRNWLLGQSYWPEIGFGPVVLGAAALLIFAWLFYRLAQPHVVVRLG